FCESTLCRASIQMKWRLAHSSPMYVANVGRTPTGDSSSARRPFLSNAPRISAAVLVSEASVATPSVVHQFLVQLSVSSHLPGPRAFAGQLHRRSAPLP